MKKKDIQELHAKTSEELVKLALGLKHDIIALKINRTSGKVKNVNEMRTKMKNRARMLTIAGSKKMTEVVKKEDK